MKFSEALSKVLGQIASGKQPDPGLIQMLDQAAKVVDAVSSFVAADGMFKPTRIITTAGRVVLGDEGVVVGDNEVSIDEDGITILYGADNINKIKWVDANGNIIGDVFVHTDGSLYVESPNGIVNIYGATVVVDGDILHLQPSDGDIYLPILSFNTPYSDDSAAIYGYSSGGTFEFRVRMKSGAIEKQLNLDADKISELTGGGKSDLHYHDHQNFAQTINDDGVYSFIPPGNAGKILIAARGTQAGANEYALAVFNTSTPLMQHIGGFLGAQTELTTGILTGTTGTDGKVTISCHTNGLIYIENRRGASRVYQVNVFAG